MDQQQQALDYQRIAKAIEYIRDQFQKPTNLREIAAHVNMSPFHFHRMFSEWAGTTPRRFLNFVRLALAKELIKEHQLSVYDAYLESGVSSTSALHRLFIQIEGMSPAAFKKAGKGLTIHYSLHPTPFGTCIVASTPIGICYMSFSDNANQAVQELRAEFKYATIVAGNPPTHEEAVSIFTFLDDGNIRSIKLHLKGSPFQLKVWEALLKIPAGNVCSYGQIADVIGQPSASRAVGTAIGQNLVGYLIPCHRVIQASGALGGYRWDLTRKLALLGWEQTKTKI